MLAPNLTSLHTHSLAKDLVLKVCKKNPSLLGLVGWWGAAGWAEESRAELVALALGQLILGPDQQELEACVPALHNHSTLAPTLYLPLAFIYGFVLQRMVSFGVGNAFSCACRGFKTRRETPSLFALPQEGCRPCLEVVWRGSCCSHLCSGSIMDRHCVL